MVCLGLDIFLLDKQNLFCIYVCLLMLFPLSLDVQVLHCNSLLCILENFCANHWLHFPKTVYNYEVELLASCAVNHVSAAIIFLSRFLRLMMGKRSSSSRGIRWMC